MSRFEFTDHSGDRLVFTAVPASDGGPAVEVAAVDYPHIPASRVEEVIAGLRDTIRQAGPAVVPNPRAAEEAQGTPRRFQLLRHRDISGVSGTGIVADGVMWPDGTSSIRWRGEHPSTVHWDRGQVSVDHVHGHQGATEVVWLDEPPRCPAGLLPLGARAVEPCVIPAGAHDPHCTASGETWAAQGDEDNR